MLFDYKCLKCNKIEERFVTTYNNSLQECSICKLSIMEKQFSAPGTFNFKGEGTYSKGLVKHGRRAYNQR